MTVKNPSKYMGVTDALKAAFATMKVDWEKARETTVTSKSHLEGAEDDYDRDLAREKYLYHRQKTMGDLLMGIQFGYIGVETEESEEE